MAKLSIEKNRRKVKFLLETKLIFYGTFSSDRENKLSMIRCEAKGTEIRDT